MANQSAKVTCSGLEAENPKNEECKFSFKTNFRKKNIKVSPSTKIQSNITIKNIQTYVHMHMHVY
jgi:hypothetical protein